MHIGNLICGCRIAVIIPVFQTGDRSSTLRTRTIYRNLKNKSADWPTWLVFLAKVGPFSWCLVIFERPLDEDLMSTSRVVSDG